MKTQTSTQLRFHSRKDLEDKIYVNHTDKIVMVWKNKKEMNDSATMPYLIMEIEEFRKFFKI